MDINEIKILLKLLTKKDYRAKIDEIKPNSDTNVSDTRNLCYQLLSRKFIEAEGQIVTFKITSKGKTLLKKKKLSEELTSAEIKILKACAQTAIKPSKIESISPAAKRDELISNLIEKGLVIIAEKQITEVWLTPEGGEFLAENFLSECEGNTTFTTELFNRYLLFIRNYFS